MPRPDHFLFLSQLPISPSGPLPFGGRSVSTGAAFFDSAPCLSLRVETRWHQGTHQPALKFFQVSYSGFWPLACRVGRSWAIPCSLETSHGLFGQQILAWCQDCCEVLSANAHKRRGHAPQPTPPLAELWATLAAVASTRTLSSSR